MLIRAIHLGVGSSGSELGDLLSRAEVAVERDLGKNK